MRSIPRRLLIIHVLRFLQCSRSVDTSVDKIAPVEYLTRARVVAVSFVSIAARKRRDKNCIPPGWLIVRPSLVSAPIVSRHRTGRFSRGKSWWRSTGCSRAGSTSRADLMSERLETRGGFRSRCSFLERGRNLEELSGLKIKKSRETRRLPLAG